MTTLADLVLLNVLSEIGWSYIGRNADGFYVAVCPGDSQIKRAPKVVRAVSPAFLLERCGIRATPCDVCGGQPHHRSEGGEECPVCGCDASGWEM